MAVESLRRSVKLFDDVPVNTGTLDFTFDFRPDFEDDLDDFLSSFLFSTRSFSFFTLWIAPLIAGKASQYLKLSKVRKFEFLVTLNSTKMSLTKVRFFQDHF